jgi:PAS domain S-box-containing protein
VQVGYLQERPQVDEGPFLEEERGLLNAIARRVGRIAERMRARQQLLEWNRFLQAVLDSLDYPFYVVNVRDWTVELANSAAYEGQSRGERTCFSLMHGRNRPCELEGSRCPLQEVVRTRRPVIVEHVHLAGDGTSRNVEVRGYPILDPQGRVVQMIEYILDITERKQAEQALRESEGRWRSLTETSPDNVLMLDTDLKIQFANYASPGLTVDELIGTPLYTLVDEARQAEIKGILEDVLRTGSSARYETVYHLPDGDDVTYESRAVARTLSGSEEVVGLTLSARDITDRKRAEAVLRQARDELELRVQERTAELVELNRGLLAEVAERRRAEQELRASEERFRQLAENVDDVIWLMEPESGRLLYISPAYEKVWGRPIPSQPEKIGSLLADVHPEDMALMPRNLAEVGTGEEIEFRLVRPHGDVRWIRARLFPVCDETGQIYRFVGIAADTTIQKKTQAALIEAERLAIAGRMAASLTHEISNPLQAAIGCLDLSLEQLDRGEDPHRHLQVTASALGRASRVVAQLRALHYPSDVEGKEVVDLNALLESVLVLVQKRCLDQSVEVIWQAEPDLPPVPLMPDAIQQLFLNLALNALDAMPQEGRLEVGARPTQEPPGILVSFTDTGCGIPADRLDAVFEPFFSTKADSLGLGLFISLNIVQQHGGRIEVESREGHGTTFTIWLPLSSQRVDHSSRGSGAP